MATRLTGPSPVVAELDPLIGIETRRIHVDKGDRGHHHAQKFRMWISAQLRRGHRPDPTRDEEAPPSNSYAWTSRQDVSNAVISTRQGLPGIATAPI